MINITYSELKNLVNTASLEEGEQYCITDFQTIYYQPVSGNPDPQAGPQKSGGIEPLIVSAIAVNKLDIWAISTLYPADIIHYDINPDCDWNVEGISKGQIMYRKDTVNNNSCHYDFRNITFRRWQLNLDLIPEWTCMDGSNAKDYHQKDLVRIGSDVYVCVASHSATQSGEFSINSRKYWAVFYRNANCLNGTMQKDDMTFYNGSSQSSNRPYSVNRECNSHYQGEFILSDKPDYIASWKTSPTNSGTSYKECYTFNKWNGQHEVKCFNNEIEKAYCTYEADTVDGNNNPIKTVISRPTLNNIVLWGSCKNKFSYECRNITLVYSYDNIFETYCRDIVMTYSDGNTFSDSCSYSFMAFCVSSKIGNRSSENALYQSVNTEWGTGAWQNYVCEATNFKLGNQCTQNNNYQSHTCSIGDETSTVTLDECADIEIGSRCSNIFIYKSHRINIVHENCSIKIHLCEAISFDDVCSFNNELECCYEMTFGKGCSNNYFGYSDNIKLSNTCSNNYFSNAHINELQEGCSGNKLYYSDFNLFKVGACFNELNSSHHNEFGNHVTYHTLSNSGNNVIMPESNKNTLNTSYSNTIGQMTYDNLLDNSSGNTIGSNACRNQMINAKSCTIGAASCDNHVKGENNHIGVSSHYNTIKHGDTEVTDNRVGNYSCYNTVSGHHNSIDDNCHWNYISGAGNENKIEKGSCFNRIILGHSNVIGIHCSNNWIDYGSVRNVLGAECHGNRFINYSHSNILEGSCCGNSFDNSTGNTLEIECHHFHFQKGYNNYIEKQNTGNSGGGIWGYPGDEMPVPQPSYFFRISNTRILINTHLQLDKFGRDMDNNAPVDHYRNNKPITSQDWSNYSYSYNGGYALSENQCYIEFKIFRIRELGYDSSENYGIVGYKYFQTCMDENCNTIKQFIAKTDRYDRLIVKA